MGTQLNYIFQRLLQLGVVIDCSILVHGRSEGCHFQAQLNENIPCAVSTSFPPLFVGLSMPSETLETTAKNAKPQSAWVSEEEEDSL